ncbi:MAG: hypothetical protein R3Y65_03480 [Bacillota bacterium]
MNIGCIFKRNIFWLKDSILNKGLIYKQYKEILKVNNACDVKFEYEKLQEIKEFAINNTEFYKNYAVDSEFPVMNKTAYIHNKELIESHMYKSSKNNHVSSTSGSTGIPFSVVQNYEKRCRTIADLKVFGKIIGYKSHDKMVCLRAYYGKVLDRNVDKRDNIWRIDVSNLNNVKINEIIIEIQEQRPTAILGYVSALETIAKFIHENNITLQIKELKSIITVSEGLSEESRKDISKAFGDIMVYDRYTNMEMGMIAQREESGMFKINQASYFIEVLKLDNNDCADNDEIGRIVITDLYNKAFPMIRYDTGDLGIMSVSTNGIYLKKILGRHMDIIFSTSGELLNPHGIDNIMHGVKGIMQWQFIQKERIKYQLLYIASEHYDIELDDVILRIKSQVGNDAVIEFMKIDAIPEGNSYKRKPIINEWKKN